MADLGPKKIGSNYQKLLQLESGVIQDGSGSATGLSLANNNLTVTGNLSGSSVSTGSFGRIDSSGRIFEAGSSVIDHATAMAIVFGG